MFKKSVLRLGAAMIAVSVSGLLAACTDAPSGQQERAEIAFVWWGNDDRANRMQLAIDAFEDAHPDINVTGTFQAEGYWDARTIEAASGNLPDVFLTEHTRIRDYGDRGASLDLDGVDGASIDVSNMDPALADTGVIDGYRYAVPLGSNTMAFFLNTDLMEEAGVDVPVAGGTWDDYISLLSEVQEKTGVAAGMDWTNYMVVFEIWLRQHGKNIFNDDGTLQVTEADLTEFWDSAEPLRDSGFFPPLSIAQQSEPLHPFAGGLVTSFAFWDTTFTQFLNENTNPRISLVPPPSDSEDLGIYKKPSLLLSVASNTEYPEAAATFVDFMANAPEVGEIFGASLGIPASSTVREAATFTEADQQVLAYEESVADRFGPAPIAAPPGWQTLETQFWVIQSDIQHGTITVDEAVAQWFSEARAALDSNN